jgi:hypothetical protein
MVSSLIYVLAYMHYNKQSALDDLFPVVNVKVLVLKFLYKEGQYIFIFIVLTRKTSANFSSILNYLLKRPTLLTFVD